MADIQERCFLHLEAPPQRVCGYDTPFPLVFEKVRAWSRACLGRVGGVGASSVDWVGPRSNDPGSPPDRACQSWLTGSHSNTIPFMHMSVSSGRQTL